MGWGGGEARYLVSVEDEVEKIVGLIDTMVQLSLKHKTPQPIMTISDCLRDSWDRYEEKSRNNRPNCTLENFWYDGENIGSELVEVRSSLLDAWQRVFGALCVSEHLKETDYIWLRKSDKIGLFRNEYLDNASSDEANANAKLKDSLALHRETELLTEEGATLSKFLMFIESLPNLESKREAIKSLILGREAPRHSDAQNKPTSLIGMRFQKLWPIEPLKRCLKREILDGRIVSVTAQETHNDQKEHCWNIEWTHADQQNAGGYRVIETPKPVSFDELLTLAPNSDRDEGFCSFLIRRLSKSDVEKAEIDDVPAFVGLFWGDIRLLQTLPLLPDLLTKSHYVLRVV
jgi:hypothetical protein